MQTTKLVFPSMESQITKDLQVSTKPAQWTNSHSELQTEAQVSEFQEQAKKTAVVTTKIEDQLEILIHMLFLQAYSQLLA